MEGCYKFEILANEIEEKIRSGIYRVGEKLPSIRNLQKTTKLSMMTIIRAFEELEDNGLVESKPKSGYYVKPPNNFSIQSPLHKSFVAQPAKISLDKAVNSIVEMTGDMSYLPLGSAIIDTRLFPARYFGRILKSFSTTDIEQLLRYGALQGDLELRRLIAQRMMGNSEIAKPDDIIITNGCLEAISVCLHALVKGGDTIAIESPTYFVLLQILHELNVTVIEIPSTLEHGFDVDALEGVLKVIDIKACLLTPNINNPMGSSMPDEKKEKLVHLAHEYNVPIIEDAIFEGLHYEPPQPRTLRSYDKHDLVLKCSSFSKTLGAGLRTGWIVTGKRFKNKILKLRAGLSISSAQWSQRLITEYMSGGGYDRHLRTLRQHLKQQTTDTAIAIQKYFPQGTQLSLPSGGFFLWVELPQAVDSMEFFNLAAEQKIFIIPGSICTNSTRFDHYVRISCGFPFTDQIHNGVKKLGEIAHDLILRSRHN